VIRYLKFFTFLSRDEIAALEKQHKENAGARVAHKALAKAVSDLVHGPAATAEAMLTIAKMFGTDFIDPSVSQQVHLERISLESVKAELPQQCNGAESVTNEPLVGLKPKASGRELFEQRLSEEAAELFFENVEESPHVEIERSKLEGAGVALVELLVHAGLYPSKGQARKDIKGGGVYVNTLRETGVQRIVTAKDLIYGKRLLLRKGKHTYVVVTAK
jgi:tyrosyl-tRNA synthetase